MISQRYIWIFSGVTFMRLRSRDIAHYQWLYPAIVSVIIFAIYFALKDEYLNFNTEKIINGISSLMEILIGFYIVSLAAISGLSNQNLDVPMKGNIPKLKSIRGEKEVEYPLSTRRHFLATLFGYCATLSIFLYIFGFLYHNVTIVELTENWMQYVAIAKYIVWVLYIWSISSLLVTTLLGLHYFVERMYRE